MKNVVTVDKENRIVTKTFRSKIAFENELSVLSKLSGTGFVPEIIVAENNTIKMDYCAGDTVASLCDSTNQHEIIHVLKILTDYLCKFSDEFYSRAEQNIVLTDFNPRNFIYNDGKVVFIDFETRRTAVKDNNFTLLLAMVLNLKFNNSVDKTTVINELSEYISKISGISADKLIADSKLIYRTNENKKHLRHILKSTTGCILAGGQSSRMGGSPKGLLKIDDFTFCDHIIYAMQPLDEVVLSANNDAYSQYNIVILEDEYHGIGPLSGLYTSTNKCKTEWIFVAPCDMPFVTEKLIYKARSMVSEDTDAVIFKSDDRLYPTLGFYKTNLSDIILNQIESGNYRLNSFLGKINYSVFSADEYNRGININTPEEYNQAKLITD